MSETRTAQTDMTAPGPPPARQLPLAALHQQHGAQFSERGGWSLPAHYGDVAGEYAAVRDGAGAGLCDLSARGRVEVSGTEAVQFLNGLITNDMKTLAPETAMNAACPNAQGRLLALVRVLRPAAEATFLCDTEPATRERVQQLLARFTLAGDFHVRDLTPETAHLSVQGAGAAALVAAVCGPAAAQVAPGRGAVCAWRGDSLTVWRATHTAEDGYDLFVAAAQAAPLWTALAAAGARPVGADALELLRVEAGQPRYGVDMDETNVVSEAVPADAISYTKGCYVGQEIIARIHWRGHVAKQLTGLLCAAAQPIAPDTKLHTADGKAVGRITSSVHSPRLGHAVALGYVKYDYLAPGTALHVAGAAEPSVRVAALPLVRGSWRPADATAAEG